MRRSLVLLLLGVVAFGAVLRLGCMGAEFWLDEIWSWELAHRAPSFFGVLAIRHDNSHPLNSLWLRLWPATAPLIVLRLPALVAGLGAIVLAAVVARRRGGAESVFAAVLVAGCSWTVFASAEARGYALAVFFALAALEALWRYLDRHAWPSLAAFWGLSALGFVSHLTFVHATIGFVVWSMRRFARERPGSLSQVRAMLLLHGPVAAFFAAYYLLVVRGMEIGGGPPASVADVLRSLISLGLGGPPGGWGWLLVVVAVIFFVMGLSLLARAKKDVWTFFAAAIVGSPALFLIRPPAYLAERYFLIPFVFFLLLTAFVLGDWWRNSSFEVRSKVQRRPHPPTPSPKGEGEPDSIRGSITPPLRLRLPLPFRGGGWGVGSSLRLTETFETTGKVLLRPLVLALLVSFLAGNAWQVRSFVESGRGEFGDALAWIAEHDDSDPLPITGDRDFRVRLYTDFYARRLSLSRVRYVGGDGKWEAHWFLLHFLPDEEGYQFTHVEPPYLTEKKAFPSRGRMSWGWFVYRVTAEPPR